MSGLPTPRVSILIPNFNNGRGSSADGRTDLLGNLLQSLDDTLGDDPTPFEVIAYDDGSTDDSLDTLRTWSRKAWADGRPWLKLIEAPHCGVLAKTANVLSRAARGDILARLDGDTVMLTPRWVSILTRLFDEGDDRLGVIAPKQLRPDMRIHAFGDFLIHPGGYVHVGSGLPRHGVQHRMRVDHAMGCFYCCRKAAYEQAGGYDERFLRGQTIDLGLRALLLGWQAMAVPEIEFIHAMSQRKIRSTRADSKDGMDQTLRTFERKWGFNRLAPDLADITRRYAGTGLLWNRQWFDDAGRLRINSASPAPPTNVAESHWGRYTQDTAFRAAMDIRAKATLDVVRQTGQPGMVAHLGCGQGIVTHVLARSGLTCIGVDEHASELSVASQMTASQQYPAARPRFVRQTDSHRLPLADGEAGLVLAPGRMLIVVSRRLPGAIDDPSEPGTLDAICPEHRYHWADLVRQVYSAGGWELAIDPKADDPQRDMVLILRRAEAAPAAFPAEWAYTPGTHKLAG